MKKILKWLGIAVVTIVVLLLAHPIWLGWVVRTGANLAVPGIIGTSFHLGKLSINLYSGKVCVGDLTVANPENFKDDPQLFTLGLLSVDFQPTTAVAQPFVINDITISDVYCTYVKEDGRYNVEVIIDNISGGEQEPKKEESEATPEPESQEESGEGFKVIIDSFALRGAAVKYRMVKLPLPPIVLTGIGRNSAGTTLVDAYTAVSDQIVAAFGSAFGAVGDAAGAVGNAVGNAAGNAASAVSDAAGNAASAVGDAAGSAASAVGDAAGNAASAVGDALSSGAGAVSEGAKKLGKGIKGLFD